MTLREKWRLFVLKFRANRVSKKMDHHVHMSYAWEDDMYKTDDELKDFVKHLKIKYV